MPQNNSAKDILKMLLDQITALVKLLPKSMQVIVIPAIIIVLLNIVNQMFSNHYIDISIRLLQPNDDTMDRVYFDQKITVIYSDNRNSMLSDNDGRIAIHKPSFFSKLPILIFNDCNRYEECPPRKELKFEPIQRISMFFSFDEEIYVYEDEPKWEPHPSWENTLNNQPQSESQISRNWFISATYAQEAATVSTLQTDSQDIADYVLENVSKLTAKELPNDAISPITLEKNLNLNSKQRSLLYYDIAKKYDIKINQQNHQIDTVGDLVELTQQQHQAKSWPNVMSNASVKPESLFGSGYLLPIENTDLKIQPVRLFSHSAQIKIFEQADGQSTQKVLWQGTVYTQERVFVKLGDQQYAIKLNAIASTGWDRLFYDKAAFFEVKKAPKKSE